MISSSCNTLNVRVITSRFKFVVDSGLNYPSMRFNLKMKGEQWTNNGAVKLLSANRRLPAKLRCNPHVEDIRTIGSDPLWEDQQPSLTQRLKMHGGQNEVGIPHGSPRRHMSNGEWKRSLEWVSTGPYAPISMLTLVVNLGDQSCIVLTPR